MRQRCARARAEADGPGDVPCRVPGGWCGGADSRFRAAPSLWMFNMSYEHHEQPPIYFGDNNDYMDSSTGLDGAGGDDDSTLIA